MIPVQEQREHPSLFLDIFIIKIDDEDVYHCNIIIEFGEFTT